MARAVRHNLLVVETKAQNPKILEVASQKLLSIVSASTQAIPPFQLTCFDIVRYYRAICSFFPLFMVFEAVQRTTDF